MPFIDLDNNNLGVNLIKEIDEEVRISCTREIKHKFRVFGIALNWRTLS